MRRHSGSSEYILEFKFDFFQLSLCDEASGRG